MRKRLGVFCGTFNPVHWGHLLMAEFARQQLNLDRVIFITSPNPPHRHTDILDAELRYKLVAAAVANNPSYEASRLELDRGGTSYTVDTLKTLQQEQPEAELNLIIGEDNLQYIGKWKSAAEIFKLAHIAVAPRSTQIIKPTDPQESSPLPREARVIFLNLPHVNVSASEIRRRLREHEPVLYMVPPAVNDILKENKLYAS